VAEEPATFRACPFCAEPIRVAAKLCRFCGREVAPDAPDAPRPAGAEGASKAAGGWGTALVICLALVVAIVVSTVASRFDGSAASSAGAVAEAGSSPSDYQDMCATAFVAAGHRSPMAYRGELGLGVAILNEGPPVRIQCAFRDPLGRDGAVTADVLCRQPLESGCVRLVSIVDDGRVLFLSKQASAQAKVRR
jgi:hypothetical protein